MIKFVWLRAEFYSYLIGNRSEDKKGKETKMYVIKRKLKFEATQLENKISNLEINKICIDSFLLVAQ